MKKILFFAIFILMFGIASSQVFIENTDATRISSVPAGADRLSPYTQKYYLGTAINILPCLKIQLEEVYLL